MDVEQVVVMLDFLYGEVMTPELRLHAAAIGLDVAALDLSRDYLNERILA